MSSVLMCAAPFQGHVMPMLEYPRSHSHPRVHFVGPLSISDVDAHPLPEWWDRLDRGRPTVLVTQGSAEPDLSQLVRPALAGLGSRNVNVVVSLGGRTTEPDLDLPENAYYAPALPYDAVFPSLAAFVTNGGYGGLGFAIRHGVPVVTVGKSQDKAEVAARVRWSGIGIGLQKQKASPRTITRAVDRVLHEDRYRTRAHHLRDEAAQAPGLDGATRIIVEPLPDN
jgi:UDP:flavonoid glycosyltransferase YjiC (YdhE family)